MLPINGPQTSSGTKLMAIFSFVLLAMPKINIKIGPVPIYLIDILIVFLVILAVDVKAFHNRARPFASIVTGLFVFAIAGEFASVVLSGEILQPIYLSARTTLAFLVFYLTGKFIRSISDLELILKSAVAAMIVTAVLMILSSLPMTRIYVSDLVFSNRFLDPNSSQVYSRYSAEIDSGVRGQTLVGISIMGATYINAIWPLAALLYVWPNYIGRWRQVAFFACLIAPMAVLMSYSRGPILGTLLLIFAMYAFGLRRLRTAFLVPIVSVGILVALIGAGSQIFFFDRLANRTFAIIESPLDDERETERLLSYVEPLAHMMDNPRFLVLGEGNGINKTNVLPEKAGKATHSLFAYAYYANGLSAAFLYMFLVLMMLRYSYWHVRNQRHSVGSVYAQALFGSVVALLPWIAFGHAIVSTPRGAMMFFFILGLLTTLRHFSLGYKKKGDHI